MSGVDCDADDGVSFSVWSTGLQLLLQAVIFYEHKNHFDKTNYILYNLNLVFINPYKMSYWRLFWK